MTSRPSAVAHPWVQTGSRSRAGRCAATLLLACPDIFLVFGFYPKRSAKAVGARLWASSCGPEVPGGLSIGGPVAGPRGFYRDARAVLRRSRSAERIAGLPLCTWPLTIRARTNSSAPEPSALAPTSPSITLCGLHTAVPLRLASADSLSLHQPDTAPSLF